MVKQIRQTLRDSAPARWLAMVLVSGLMFGTYWFQDFMGGLKPLMESQLGFSSSDFGFVIGMTTIANVFGMIIVGGMILDKWGIRVAGLLFGAIAAIGAFITAAGSAGLLGTDKSAVMWTMVAGRILFGVGLEVVCVVVTRTIVKWFKGKELALAMGVNMGFGRLGSAIGVGFSSEIGGGSVSASVFFSASVIGFALVMFLAYLMMDVKLDRQLSEGASFEEEEPFRLSDLLKLVTNPSFVAITLLCVAFYSAVFPFIQYAPDLLINKFGFTLSLPDLTHATFFEKLQAWFTNGPKVTSLIPIGTILFTPVFGSIIDKKGKAATLMVLGSLLLIFAHLALSVFDNVILGYAGLVALGVAFSLVPASMWPSVAKIVPENRLGTAYATMFTVQNWGLAAFFWGIGKVLDLSNPEIVSQIETKREALKASGLTTEAIGEAVDLARTAGEIPPYNYTVPILMLVVLGIVSIFLALMLKNASAKQGYGLENPSNG
jgi:MFS family permease